MVQVESSKAREFTKPLSRALEDTSQQFPALQTIFKKSLASNSKRSCKNIVLLLLLPFFSNILYGSRYAVGHTLLFSFPQDLDLL